MAEVKYQHIINDTVRNKLFDIPNIKKQIAKKQQTLIGKVARYSDNHILTKLITTWCNHKRQPEGVLHSNKKSIVHNLRLVISGVDKNVVIKIWAHFAFDGRYWENLI